MTFKNFHTILHLFLLLRYIRHHITTWIKYNTFSRQEQSPLYVHSSYSDSQGRVVFFRKGAKNLNSEPLAVWIFAVAIDNMLHKTMREVYRSVFPANKVLSLLLEQGRIIKTGAARGTKYLLK